MDTTSILDLLFHGNQLKQIRRSGWMQRGIANPESVAAHSYGVCFVAMVLVHLIEEEMDLAKVLSMATLHDLPEGLTTDIPTPAARFLPGDSKLHMERGAMGAILDGSSLGPKLMALWEELHGKETAESQLVHDADKLDMYLQALIYEESSGNRRLAEFWDGSPVFHFPEAQAVYGALRSRRERNAG